MLCWPLVQLKNVPLKATLLGLVLQLPEITTKLSGKEINCSFALKKKNKKNKNPARFLDCDLSTFVLPEKLAHKILSEANMYSLK